MNKGRYTVFICYLPYRFYCHIKAHSIVVNSWLNEYFCNYEIAYKYSVYADNSKTHIEFYTNFIIVLFSQSTICNLLNCYNALYKNNVKVTKFKIIKGNNSDFL